METLLKHIYKEFISPVGIMTVLVENPVGLLQKGDIRGSTISSFRIIDEGHCLFSYSKSRIMASCLHKNFAFHYLYSHQIALAKSFALNGLSCPSQFACSMPILTQGIPTLPEYHSLILGEIDQRLEFGESYVYIGRMTYIEVKGKEGILHYAQRDYI